MAFILEQSSIIKRVLTLGSLAQLGADRAERPMIAPFSAFCKSWTILIKYETIFLYDSIYSPAIPGGYEKGVYSSPFLAL